MDSIDQKIVVIGIANNEFFGCILQYDISMLVNRNKYCISSINKL